MVSHLFKDQCERADTDAFSLSPEDISDYNDFGYISGVRILNDAQCDELCLQLEDLANVYHPNNYLFHEYNSNESEDPSTVLFHALGAWRAAPGFHDALWNPAFTVPASQLLGGPVRFWHDQLFCKPAQTGGVVAWHQDYSYWTRTRPMQHLTCWIGLDDSDEENGCLHYIPGSHKRGLLPVTGLAGDMNAIRDVLSDEEKEEFIPTAIHLKRGEASFHHPMMVHGSYENRSDRARRAMVINVVLDGVMSDTDDPLLEGVPVISKGSILDGRFFPLLYSPEQ
ncbi:phytanoyl-CoA dioxygenase family protein [bacterium AH-315-P07]|nr:phytanoyl-CoA dioxygenase family protein [bacterium AH-315-P07]